MKNYECNTIIIGIGNSGRQDDGLGWAFLDKIKSKLPAQIDIEYRYQLQIEDAELISHYNNVFFVDAHKKELENGVLFEKCTPKDNQSFSSHALSPETILYLTNTIYNKNPETTIIGISGKEFELKIGLTKYAKKNLFTATSIFLKNILKRSYKPIKTNNNCK